MDEFFKKMFRLRQGHRAAVERKRRIANLVSNSNCIGTTAHLFNSEWSRAVTGDLMQCKAKKPVTTDFSTKKLKITIGVL